ncbi:MAG: hypothetical protein WAV92_01645 [Halopseudomonas yangmingensis]
MQKKTIAASLLIASLGLLGACQSEPEDKLDSATSSVNEAVQNLGDAAEQAVREATGTEKTTGERISKNIDEAGEAVGEAYDKSAEKVHETYEKAKELIHSEDHSEH